MDYSNAYLNEFLPRENPPEDSVPGDVEDEIYAWTERAEFPDKDLVARSTRWTYAMFSALGEGQIRRSNGIFAPLGTRLMTRTASIGLYDPAEHPGFGLVINVPPWDGPVFDIIDTITFPRLGHTFPLAIRQSAVELHAPHHPANATSACWAQCNRTQDWGVLTAGHAISGNRPGRHVPLAGGSSGTLRRSYYQPIDAAFVATGAPPFAPTLLPTLSFPASGLPVTIACQSGSQPRTVVSVSDSLGVVQTREFAVLLHLDQPASPGDSGALVRLQTGEAVGIYKGALHSPKASSPFGLAQNFEQAVFALDVNPYL